MPNIYIANIWMSTVTYETSKFDHMDSFNDYLESSYCYLSK